jgi:transcription initiation factor TFIID subunit 13
MNQGIGQYNGMNQMPMNMLPPITNLKKRRRKQRIFQKDIEALLYGMGDGPILSDQTVGALEDILQEYLMDLCHKTLGYAKSQGRSRIKMNDICFTLRNDPLKLARFQYILEQTYRIERAKKMLDDFGEDKLGNLSDGDDEDDENGKSQKGPKKKKKKVTGNIMIDKVKKVKRED